MWGAQGIVPNNHRREALDLAERLVRLDRRLELGGVLVPQADRLRREAFVGQSPERLDDAYRTAFDALGNALGG